MKNLVSTKRAIAAALLALLVACGGTALAHTNSGTSHEARDTTWTVSNDDGPDVLLAADTTW